MNKRYLHHIWTRLRPVSYWYFLIAFLLSATIAVFALRQNNLEMIRLREAVVQADRSGRGVNEALNNLREYVYSHMNTDLTSGNSAIRPPIQLTHTYDRLTRTERNRVIEHNKKVNEDAMAICERQFPAGQLQNGRVQCVQDYITRNSIAEQQVVPKELYQFDFVSPVWSPDVAGWSIVAAVIFFFLFLLRFGLERWLKHSLEA